MTPLILHPEEIRHALTLEKGQTFVITRPIEDLVNDDPDVWNFIAESKSQPGCFRFRPHNDCELILESPFGKPGQEFFVQEDYSFHRCWDKWTTEKLGECEHDDTILYLADGASLVLRTGKRGPITAGIKREASTMPQSASRLTVRNAGTEAKQENDEWKWFGTFEVLNGN